MIPYEHKVQITLEIAKILLSSIVKSNRDQSKEKRAMLKRIDSIKRNFANSNKVLAMEYGKAMNKNEQIKIWVFDLLEQANVFKCDATGDKFEINKDKMFEYYESIVEGNYVFIEEVSKVDFGEN